LEIIGREVAVREVLAEARKDRLFFDESVGAYLFHRRALDAARFPRSAPQEIQGEGSAKHGCLDLF